MDGKRSRVPAGAPSYPRLGSKGQGGPLHQEGTPLPSLRASTWGTLRWADLQAIIPGELSLAEGRLVTTLRKTKTSRASRRVKELPVCISERAFFACSGWLATGFNLLKVHANYKRDYLLPRLGSEGQLERKMAVYADAMVATASILAVLGLPSVLQGFWTEHSERAVLPIALALQDVAPQDGDLLGRWKPEGSDTYALNVFKKLRSPPHCP